MEEPQLADALDHPLVMGPEALSTLGRDLEALPSDTACFILADTNTVQACLPRLLALVPQLANATVITMPAGEAFKHLETCQSVWRQLLAAGADRHSLLLNLGGGVVGDLGGWVAAGYQRGIGFIQLPTSLLAQVDASVGGKVGINLDGHKNQLGAFARPRAVYAFPGFLETLDEREWRSGLAEMAKHGLIGSRDHWQALVQTGLKPGAIPAALIAASVAIKQQVVARDPKEQGWRQVLNFGHTVGHAIERWSLQHNPWRHGEAIALGMVVELQLSENLSGFPANDRAAVTEVLNLLIPSMPFTETDSDLLWESMQSDKKNRGGTVRCTLLKAIGEPEVGFALSKDQFHQAWRQCLLQHHPA
ncbi:MAG: 3-dehydroquinate synthase [Bacteroidota bacterium]